MSTTINGTFTIHPTEIIEVTGKQITKNNSERVTSIYLLSAEVEELRRVFEFQRLHCPHLGHAYWHVHDGHPQPCGQCKDA